MNPSKSTARKIIDFPLVSIILAFAALYVAMSIALATFNVMRGTEEDSGMAIELLTIGVVMVTYKLIIAKLGDPKRDELPFSLSAMREAGNGTLGAFVLMSLMVGIAAIIDVYNIVGPGTTDNVLPMLVGMGLSAGIIEEILFRGILFRWIEQMLGSYAALALTALLFGFAHAGNPNATFFSSFAIAVEAGLLLGAAYMLTRSLWLAIGLHFGWNVTQGLIWDVSVSGNDVEGLVEAEMSGAPILSGGMFGLEASIIGLTVGTLAGLWLLKRAIAKGELVQPMWVRKRQREKAALGSAA